MYAPPVVTPAPGASAAKKGAAPMIASICCLGVVLFLISAAIILALIPIYISSRAAAANLGAQRSKEITLITEADRGGARSSDRRRQVAGDLNQYIGGEFTDAGKQMVKAKLDTTLADKNFAGADVSKASIALADSTTKKRYALYKRASSQVPVIIIRFFITFARGCGFRCQTLSGPRFGDKLKRGAPGYTFTNVPIILNGISITIASIRFTTFRSLSDIIPGLSGVTPAPSLATVTTTSTTTTTATPTPAMSG